MLRRPDTSVLAVVDVGAVPQTESTLKELKMDTWKWTPAERALAEAYFQRIFPKATIASHATTLGYDYMDWNSDEEFEDY